MARHGSLRVALARVLLAGLAIGVLLLESRDAIGPAAARMTGNLGLAAAAWLALGGPGAPRIRLGRVGPVHGLLGLALLVQATGVPLADDPARSFAGWLALASPVAALVLAGTLFPGDRPGRWLRAGLLLAGIASALGQGPGPAPGRAAVDTILHGPGGPGCASDPGPATGVGTAALALIGAALAALLANLRTGSRARRGGAGSGPGGPARTGATAGGQTRLSLLVLGLAFLTLLPAVAPTGSGLAGGLALGACLRRPRWRLPRPGPGLAGAGAVVLSVLLALALEGDRRERKVEIGLVRAGVHAGAGRPESALHLLERVLSLDPRRGEARLAAAWLAMDLGCNEAAATFLEPGPPPGVDPFHEAVLRARAMLVRGRGRESHAVFGGRSAAEWIRQPMGPIRTACRAFGRLAKMLKDQVDQHVLEARTHSRSAVEAFAGHRPDEARRHLEQAVTLDPRRVDDWAKLAHLVGRSGDDTGSRAILERALVHAPGDPHLLNEHGLVLQRLGDPAGALASFDRAMVTTGAPPHLLHNRAQVLVTLGRSEEAASDLRAFLDRWQGDPARAEIARRLLARLSSDPSPVRARRIISDRF